MRSVYQQKYVPQPSAEIDPVRLRKRLIASLKGKGITNNAVLAAMEAIPRHLFVTGAWKAHAYEDRALPIGNGQTISQPFMVARMLEFLEVESGMSVLEVGMGSGYQTALLGSMGCSVYAIERLRDLYLKAVPRFKKLGLRNIYAHCGDGTLGFPQAAPFNRIIVAAGGPAIPQPLINQLAPDGVLLIPVGDRPRSQRLARLRLKHGKVLHEDLGPAIFVNLVGDLGWETV